MCWRSTLSPLLGIAHFRRPTIRADLSKEAECLTALRGARSVFNLAADMGGIGFSQSSVHAFGADQHTHATCGAPTWG